MSMINDKEAFSENKSLDKGENENRPTFPRRSSSVSSILALDDNGITIVHGDSAVATAARIMLKSQREGDMKTVSRVSRDLANLFFPSVAVTMNEYQLQRTSKNAVELVALMASKFQAKTIHNLLPGVLPLLSGDRNLLKTVETLHRMLTVVRNNVQQLERMDEYSKHVASKHESVVHDIERFLAGAIAKHNQQPADPELDNALAKCSLHASITACEVTLTNAENTDVGELLDEKANRLFLLALANEVRLSGYRVIGDAILTAAICCAKNSSGEAWCAATTPERWYAATTEKWFWKAAEAYQRVVHWTDAVEKQSALDACHLGMFVQLCS